jgi:uncharacterized protein YndB with AHSA1/START domain
MDARNESEKKHTTMTERTSEREAVVRRTFNAPARLVFEAWTTPALLKRWWAPRSFGVSLLTCEVDLRAGGTYRYVFGKDAMEPMAFFGRYVEVTPHSRLVWTNDEDAGGGSVTTATFEERDGKTRVVVHDLYPSKEALDAAMASGMDPGMREAHGQLDELLVTLAASA